MSPKPNQEDRCANKVVLAQGCLAIIFQRNSENDNGEHNVTISRGRNHTDEERLLAEDGYFLFQEFLRENRCCFWNASLSQSVENLHYKGFLTPCTILVTSSMYSLEVIRSAWARRLLHSPTNYNIVKLGDVPCVEMDAVSQVQFAPLGEALCNVIFELNAKQISATLEVISERLQINFPEMVIPQDEVLYKTLGSLIRDRKLYHSGQGYCVVTPHTYILTSQTTVNERPILMTNEEAIIKLHGFDSFSCEEHKHTRTCCVQVDGNTNCYGSEGQVLEPSKSSGNLERSQSVRLLRVRRRSKSEEHTKISRSGSFKLKSNKRIAQEMNDSKSDLENLDNDKKEKSSVLNWLFRKGVMRADKRTSKLTTFSAQFPPVSGQDVESVHLHSRGTQTLNEDMFVASKVNRTSSLSRSSHYGRHSLLLQSTTGVLSPREQRSQTDHRYLISKSASLPRKSYHMTNKICETKYVPYSNNKATHKRNLYHNSPYLESSGAPSSPGDSVSAGGLDTQTSAKFNNTDILRKDKVKYPIIGANNLQQNTSFNKPVDKVSDLYSSSGPKKSDMPTRFTVPQTTKKANHSNVSCTENQTSSEIPARKSVPFSSISRKSGVDVETELSRCSSQQKTAVELEISFNTNKKHINDKKIWTKETSSPNEIIKTNVCTSWNHRIPLNTEGSDNLNTHKPSFIKTTTNISTSLSSDALEKLMKPGALSMSSSCPNKDSRITESLNRTLSESGHMSLPVKLKLAEAKASFFSGSPC